MNCLIDHILYQIFKIIFSTSSKILRHMTDETRLLIYANETEIIITFKKKSAYYRALSTTEKMKFLGSTKNRITKDKNGKHVPLLEINEVKLLYWTFIGNNYHHD